MSRFIGSLVVKQTPAELVLVVDAFRVITGLVDTTGCELLPCFGWIGPTVYLNCLLV